MPLYPYTPPCLRGFFTSLHLFTIFTSYFYFTYKTSDQLIKYDIRSQIKDPHIPTKICELLTVCIYKHEDVNCPATTGEPKVLGGKKSCCTQSQNHHYNNLQPVLVLMKHTFISILCSLFTLQYSSFFSSQYISLQQDCTIIFSYILYILYFYCTIKGY